MSTITLEQVVNFLLGEGKLNGVWFGENPGERGNHWWRKYLREASANLAQSAQGETVSLWATGRNGKPDTSPACYRREDAQQFCDQYNAEHPELLAYAGPIEPIALYTQRAERARVPDGLLIAVATYMGAVKDIFALRHDGKRYNERGLIHDAGALRAFVHLNAATVALKQAVAAVTPSQPEPNS